MFISYGHEDRASAQRLHDDLRAVGLSPWLDVEALQPGARWKPAIIKAIRASDFFVLLLSIASTTRRGFVNVEVREALDIVKEMPEDRPFLVPARLDDCTPSHGELSEFNWVDLFPEWDRSVRRLAVAMIASQPANFAATDAPVRPRTAAFVQVTISSGASVRGAIRAIEAVAPSTEIYAVFGPSDLLVYFPDIELSTIGPRIELIRQLPEVADVEWTAGSRATASDRSLDL